MATEVLAGSTNYPILNGQTRLGDDTIGPGLAADLQQFYERTDSYADKAKCLELLASIRTGDHGQGDAPRRPYSAIPAYGQDHSKNFLSPYQTTTNRDYPLKYPIETQAMRPMTSHGFPPHEGPPANTHYFSEYHKKTARPLTPLRPGTASGNRANNPHPSQTFMVWKFPRGGVKETEGSTWSDAATDQKISQVHKRLCQSIYQQDFLGAPQGFQLKSAYAGLPHDWKENIPYSLDSVQRYCYRDAKNPDELQIATTRYGSNRNKPFPATGTVPSSSARHMHIRNRTTYDRHYNDNSDAVKGQIYEDGKRMEAEAIQKILNEQRDAEDRRVRSLPPPTPHLPAHQPYKPPPVFKVQNPMNRPPSGIPHARLRSGRNVTPMSTPISTPYVPLPPANIPNDLGQTHITATPTGLGCGNL